MFNVLQKSACMQSSATVCRTDTMDYRPRIAAYSTKKWGSVHISTPTARKWTPTGLPPLKKGMQFSYAIWCIHFQCPCNI